MKRSATSLAVFVLACGAVALAEDGGAKVVFFKNGSRVQGEILPESDQARIIMTLRDGSRLTIPRRSILRIEDAPPEERPASAGGETAPAATKPATGTASAPPTESPRAPATTPATGTAATTSATRWLADAYRPPAASVVADCRNFLAGASRSDEERAKAIALAAERFGVPAIVALIVAPERDAAFEAAVAAVRSEPDRFRAEVVRATLGTRCAHDALVELLEVVFDASVERSIGEVIRAMKPMERMPLAPILERRGTRASAAVLADVIVAWRGADPTAFGRALSAIAARDPEPQDVVRPLVQKLIGASFDVYPPDGRLEGTITALRHSPTTGAPIIMRLVRKLDADLRVESEEGKLPLIAGLEVSFKTLAAMDSDSVLEDIERTIAAEEDARLRARLIRTLATKKNGGENVALLRWLVAHWEAHPEDAQPVSEILTAFTQQSFSNSLGEWRDHVAKLGTGAR